MHLTIPVFPQGDGQLAWCSEQETRQVQNKVDQGLILKLPSGFHTVLPQTQENLKRKRELSKCGGNVNIV